MLTPDVIRDFLPPRDSQSTRGLERRGLPPSCRRVECAERAEEDQLRSWLLSFALSLALAGAAQAQAQDQQARLAALHQALNLASWQEAAWHDYAAAISANPGALARHRAAQGMMSALTTPRRLALLDAMLEHDLADLRRQGAVVVKFYKTLSPQQQAVFDRETLQGPQDRADAE
jgi:hypothetical protein